MIIKSIEDLKKIKFQIQVKYTKKVPVVDELITFMYPCVLTCFFSEDNKIVYQDSFMITRNEKLDEFVRNYHNYDSMKINKMSERIKYLFRCLEEHGETGQMTNPKKFFNYFEKQLNERCKRYHHAEIYFLDLTSFKGLVYLYGKDLNKLESYPMKANKTHCNKPIKTNSLKKSYKKMTGNISQLGKNFGKLI